MSCPTANIKEVKSYRDVRYNAAESGAAVSVSENRQGCPVPLWARNSQVLSDKFCKKICDKAGSCKAVSVTSSDDYGYVCTLSTFKGTKPSSDSHTFVRK